MHTVSPGATVIDQFPAFEEDGYTKRSGLTAGDFTVSSFQDGAVVALIVTIAEIGSTGEYRVSCVPSVDGFWNVQVLVDFNKDIWELEIRVGPSPTSIDLQLVSVLSQLGLIKDGGTGLFEPGKDSMHHLRFDVARVLGLLHYNAMVDKQEYDVNNQLKYARLRVFDAPEHMPAVPGGNEVTWLEQEYEVRAEYDGKDIVREFTLKKVL